MDCIAAPYTIRALAKAIRDADDENLHEPNGKLNNTRLKELLQQIDRPLSEVELKQFHAVYAEYSLRLRGVDLTLAAKGLVTDILRLTTAIDLEAQLAGLKLSQVLESVIRTHQFFANMLQIDVSSLNYETFGILSSTISNALTEILKVVRYRVDRRREEIPVEVQRRLVKNASALWFHIGHMEWLLNAAKQSLFFDASAHITDVAALAVWKQYVGIHVPACSVEKFLPALEAFPKWAHVPLCNALNYLNAGIVSVYSLSRVLLIWGPFSLLDRNFRKDLAERIVAFETTTQEQQIDMSSAIPGSFVVTLSRSFGHLDLQFVTPTGKLKCIEINRDTGAWLLYGISSEHFETVVDACKTLPKVLVSSCGENYGVPPIPETELCDSYSILHRACFQNNVGYVRRLLDNGSSIIVNTAVADPSITPNFLWTPLHCSVNNPNSDPHEVAEMLLACGAEIGFEDRATCTALYYAIVNSWPKTVKVLLAHCPSLSSSRFTTPLFLALGAHHYNASEADNRRVAGLVPASAVVVELLKGVKSSREVIVAIRLVESKMSGGVVRPGPDWDFGVPVALLTAPQIESNDQTIAEHGVLCRRHAAEMKEVLRILQMHSFFVSCQDLVKSMGLQ